MDEFVELDKWSKWMVEVLDWSMHLVEVVVNQSTNCPDGMKPAMAILVDVVDRGG